MRRELLLMILVLLSMVVQAQTGLNIERLFDGRYRKSANATEILVKGKKANELKLSTYRSLTLSGDADGVVEMEQLLAKDGLGAESKEVEYRGGKLYYCFYILSNVKSKKGTMLNRYIFYLNQNLNEENPIDKTILIYMEGWASADYVRRLISE